MSVPLSVQLLGRHVLPLVLAAVCLLSVSSGDGCDDPDLDITRAHGEQWLLPNCRGVATCKDGLIYSHSCPGITPQGCRRVSDDDDRSAAYPRCCPRHACDQCYSKQLNQSFGPGDHWTETPCVHKACHMSPSGTPVMETIECGMLGSPPSRNCEVVGQDLTRGEFPLCCAFYRCPGLCRSGDQWVPDVGARGDSCHQAGDPGDTVTPWRHGEW